MNEPTRADVDAFTEPTLLEFGTTWCGYCQAAQAYIASVLRRHPSVRHIKVEDGKEKVIGYNVDGWTDVSGIKVPTRWSNIGYGKDSPQAPLEVPEAWKEDLPPGITAPNPGEVIVIIKPTIDSEPDDDLYIPVVTGP